MSGSWRTDPTGRHVYRYHDGERWTDQVADGGAATTDPYDGPDDAGRPSPDPAPPADTPQGGGPTPTAWPTGSAPGSGGGAGPGPGWSGGGGQGLAPAAGRGGWSTGAKVGAAIGVLGLMLVSGVIGFAIGVAADVGSEFGGIVEDFEDFEDFGDRALPGEVVPTGVVLSSDQPRFEGTLPGESSIDLLVTRASRVEVEVLEADFDTFVLLYDETGQLVDQDDDGGSERLSLIEVDLSPGTYTLVVEAFSGSVSAGERVEIVARFDQSLG